MEIVVAIPGRTWTHGFGCSMLALVAETMRRGVKLHFMQETSADLYVNRNLCVCPLTGKDPDGNPEQEKYPIAVKDWRPFNDHLRPDRIFWIDTDMVFTPDQFFRLVDHDEDFVSGCCMSGPNDLALGYYGYRKEDGKPYLSNLPRWKRTPDGREVLDAFAMWAEDHPTDKGLRVVDYVGLAFVCTKPVVYDRLEYPYFRTTFIQAGNAEVQTSEDVGFCWRVRKSGTEIYADPKVKITHQKTINLVVE